jgi:peptide subunit release factor 1 (eRF1)
MFSQEEMQELVTYEGNGEGVVSVYLDTDNTIQSIDAIKLTARTLLKEVQPQRDKEAQFIERYLDLSYDWAKPGLALFCAQEGNFFRAYQSPVAFRNRIRLGAKPYVKPLAHLLDHYAHFGVILVDRVRGRFIAYHLGEPQAAETYTGEEVRKTKDGAGSSAIGRRGGSTKSSGGGKHEDEVAARNMRECAAAASRFFAERPIRRLFLAGTSENVAQFRELLPKQLLSCLVDSFPMAIDANEPEVRQRALGLLREANAEREVKLVERMAALNAQGANAVVGLDNTLQAVSDKRVDTLIISDGFKSPGYAHDPSGYLVANLALSPLGEGELTVVPDVVDEAVAQTVAQGGHVEVIADNFTLEDAGRIGAILRY